MLFRCPNIVPNGNLMVCRCPNIVPNGNLMLFRCPNIVPNGNLMVCRRPNIQPYCTQNSQNSRVLVVLSAIGLSTSE